MHKKLLLMMLVPILALSLVVVGCGGDDGEFDGAGTYHRVAGIWYQALDGENVNAWFTAVGNQAAVYDGVGAAGVVSRTSFSFASMPTSVMYRNRYLDQLAFRQAFVRELNTLVVPGSSPPVLIFPPDSEGLNTAGGSFGVLDPVTTTWAFIMGINVHQNLIDGAFVDMFPDSFFGREMRNIAMTTPLYRLVVRLGLLYDSSTTVTPVPGFMAAALPPQLGVLDPEPLFPWTLIPFRMTFHAFYGGREIGRISGFWAEGEIGAFDSQQLIVTESFVVELAENLFIPPFGPFERNMPEGTTVE